LNVGNLVAQNSTKNVGAYTMWCEQFAPVAHAQVSSLFKRGNLIPCGRLQTTYHTCNGTLAAQTPHCACPYILHAILSNQVTDVQLIISCYTYI